jgi:hypothetical protein
MVMGKILAMGSGTMRSWGASGARALATNAQQRRHPRSYLLG